MSKTAAATEAPVIVRHTHPGPLVLGGHGEDAKSVRLAPGPEGTTMTPSEWDALKAMPRVQAMIDAGDLEGSRPA